jgi:hypothetical protein
MQIPNFLHPLASADAEPVSLAVAAHFVAAHPVILIKGGKYVFHKIDKLIKTEKRNIAALNTLLKDLHTALDTILYIGDVSPPSEAYNRAVGNLYGIINQCAAFMKTYSKESSCIRTLKSSSHRNKINDFISRLNDHHNRVLNGMVAYNFGRLSIMEQQQGKTMSFNTDNQRRPRRIVQRRY